MLNVDEFESVFRAADKKLFRLAPPTISRVLVVHDLSEPAAFANASRALLSRLPDSAEWSSLSASDWDGVEGLLSAVEDAAPDLLVAYRNLNSDAHRFNFSLGVYLNALTRATSLPVVVTPHPLQRDPSRWARTPTHVMVVEDHLTGDDALINWGAALVGEGGALHLAHVENDRHFERLMTAISKVPEIDTDVARERILEQLLREPRDYIATCKAALAEAGAKADVREHVVMAHRVADYRALVEREGVDLLAFPALEEDTIALDGSAYSLAVELVETPILML